VIPLGPDGGYQRIGGYLNKLLHVPENLPPTIKNSELVLNLGYQDDNYSDNGYYSHDNGNYNQCKNKGPAFVVVKVVSQAGGAVAWTSWSKPFDLTWHPDNIDANALPVNPYWGYQIDPKGPARGNPAGQRPNFQEWCGSAFSWNYAHHG